MNNGRWLALLIVAATLVLIVISILHPNESAVALADAGTTGLLRPSSTPQAAVENLARQIGQRQWGNAYSRLANKGEFTEQEFVRDLTGTYLSLRSYASLDHFEVRPLHASADEAQMQLKLYWSTVVGTFTDTKDLHVVRNGDRWQAEWPLVKESRVPPQVIPVNYLRWDVIYRGPEDDWGAQDVESPHVRIVDMHPLERGDGVLIMGELLNEDVVPAYVSVKATLLAKNGSAIATGGSFDKISHLLLPKQVTPFLIPFANVSLSQVGSVRMDPTSSLIAASADPVIAIKDQQLNPAPGASLTGKLVDQSGQVVNVAHVLGTFYDKNGKLVWVADHYMDRALLPQIPASFTITLPPDIAGQVSSERAVVATYSSGGLQ
ncbi:MAG: hypothetical protein QOJ51_4470 [Acidobacteriaceae bacterium]|jgi:hypothetical protein|nr:hypothetical protein [Acidobacteriaceae bacterium]MEA2261645.1 hypothetical protein [Acidobacteriaceae bacterium]